VTERPRSLADPGDDRFVRRAAVAGVAGLVTYVGGWIVAGMLRPGYRPAEQAISELFELGAPWHSRGFLVAGLVLSGAALIAFGPALHRALPGRGRLGPTLVVVSGVFTLLVVAAPCSPGCPGPGHAWNDTAHSVTAAIGYVSLVLAPLAFAHRLRTEAPRLAAWSAAIGGSALALFALRYSGVVPRWPGAQQRLFNTVADAWYLIAAGWMLRAVRVRSASRRGGPRRVPARDDERSRATTHEVPPRGAVARRRDGA
jgi:hypothetical protein